MRVTSSWLTEGAGSVHQRPAPPAAGIHATTPSAGATVAEQITRVQISRFTVTRIRGGAHVRGELAPDGTTAVEDTL